MPLETIMSIWFIKASIPRCRIAPCIIKIKSSEVADSLSTKDCDDSNISYEKTLTEQVS